MSKTQDERLFDAAKVAVQGLIASYLPYREDETVLERRFWNYITANIDDITEAILEDDEDAYEVYLDEEQEDIAVPEQNLILDDDEIKEVLHEVLLYSTYASRRYNHFIATGSTDDTSERLVVKDIEHIAKNIIRFGSVYDFYVSEYEKYSNTPGYYPYNPRPNHLNDLYDLKNEFEDDLYWDAERITANTILSKIARGVIK